MTQHKKIFVKYGMKEFNDWFQVQIEKFSITLDHVLEDKNEGEFNDFISFSKNKL